MIAIDACALSLLINPGSRAPLDPTNQPIDRVADRFDYFQRQIIKTNNTLLIPTPALAEVLVAAEDGGPELLSKIMKSSHFKVASFDELAAVEVAYMSREAILKHGNKRGNSSEPWQKVKYDRQIIAIAKVNGADVIYTDDNNVANFAQIAGISVVRVYEMDLPPEGQNGLFD